MYRFVAIYSEGKKYTEYYFILFVKNHNIKKVQNTADLFVSKSCVSYTNNLLFKT